MEPTHPWGLRPSRHQAWHLDPRTGLPDAEAFDWLLHEEWHRAERTGGMLALAALAVDRPELMGDDQAGETRWHALAEAVSEGANRAGDAVALGPSNTLLILLPETDVPGAQAVATAVLTRVRHLAARSELFQPGAVPTASLGFAALFPSPQRAATDLLAMALKFLRIAQERGGDRAFCGE